MIKFTQNILGFLAVNQDIFPNLYFHSLQLKCWHALLIVLHYTNCLLCCSLPFSRAPSASQNPFCQSEFLLPVRIPSASQNSYYQSELLLPVRQLPVRTPSASQNSYYQSELLMPVKIPFVGQNSCECESKSLPVRNSLPGRIHLPASHYTYC